MHGLLTRFLAVSSNLALLRRAGNLRIFKLTKRSYTVKLKQIIKGLAHLSHGSARTFLLTPALSFAPLVEATNEEVLAVATSALLLLERDGPSDPFDFELYLYDVEKWGNLITKALNERGLRDVFSLHFLYNPYAFDCLGINHIPALLTIDANYITEKFKGYDIVPLQVITVVTELQYGDRPYMGILLEPPSACLEELIEEHSNMWPLSRRQVLSPLTHLNLKPVGCLSGGLEELISCMLSSCGNGRKGKALIEMWSSVLARKAVAERACYLWLPYVIPETLPVLKRAVEELARLAELLVIAEPPLTIFAEQGATNEGRVWVSTVVEGVYGGSRAPQAFRMSTFSEVQFHH